MRSRAAGIVMRSLRDIRLSPLSLVIVATLSAVATIVILSGGGGKTPAQMAALTALRERPTTTVVRAAAPAQASSQLAATTDTGGGGSDSGGSVSDSGATPASSSQSASSSDAGDSDDSSDSSGSDDSGSDDSGSDDSGSSTPSSGAKSSPRGDLPKVGHVFEIALSTTGYAAAFGHGSAAPYLRSLEPRGTLLKGFKSLGSTELADNLAMISGQAPDADTRGGCTTYAEFPTAVVAKSNGLVPGNGCVYPETALTIGDQVSATGHVWKAYIEDMAQPCSHPNSNAVDDTALPNTKSGYDTRHNPFIYFHSLLDLGDCASDDEDLSKLAPALASRSKTATFSYLAPGACADAMAVASTTTTGTDPTTTTPSTTSADPASAASPTQPAAVVSGAAGLPTATVCPDGPVGIAAEDSFLKTWVPQILRSPAYKKNGVLIIAFTGDSVHASGPKVPTGALVLSRYAHKAKRIAKAYSSYSLLHSVDEMLGYTPLAKAKSAPSFAAAVLTKTK